MRSTWHDVVELGRDLPFEERVAAARELLIPPEEDLPEELLREIEYEASQRDTLLPYEQVQQELELGAYAARA